MNLKQQLLKEHSKENSLLIFNYLLENPWEFDGLMKIFTEEDYRLNQRSAWVIGMIGETKSEWLLPYFPILLDCLNNPNHDAISRNIYRSFQSLEIPEEFAAQTYNLCIRDLSNTKTAAAIKVFAMTVAFNISNKHRELQQELSFIIEEQISYSSVGFASRARKILKAISNGKNKY